MPATARSFTHRRARCRCGVRLWPSSWRGAVSRWRALSCAAIRRQRSTRGELRHPVPRDDLPPADPDAVVRAEMLDKSDQRLGAAGMTANAHVQPNRHHSGVLGAFLIEQVEAVAEIGEEILARPEHAASELYIIGRER